MSKAQVRDEAIFRDEDNSDLETVSATLTATGGTASGDFYANYDGNEILLDHSTIAPSQGDNNDVEWTFSVDTDGDGTNDTETGLGGTGTIDLYGGLLTLSYNSETGAWSVTRNASWNDGLLSSGSIFTSIEVKAYGDDGGSSIQFTDTASINLFVTCFAPDTQILCPTGVRPAGELAIADEVTTADGNRRKIRWIAKTNLDAADLAAQPNLRPVRLEKGSLGTNCPNRTLVVSPQHRILLRSKIAERMFGSREILVPAKKLVGWPNITVDLETRAVTYVHLLLEKHELLVSDGVVSESMFWGKQVDRDLWVAAYDEAVSLFPELSDEGFEMETVRMWVANTDRIATLKARHIAKNRPLVEPFEQQVA